MRNLHRTAGNACLLLTAFVATVTSNVAGQCTFDWRPGGPIEGLDAPVRAMTQWYPDGSGPKLLVVGGQFIAAGDTVSPSIAAWDGKTWTALGDGLNGAVMALTVYQGDLIAGGTFNLGGETQQVARWDGESWQPLGAPMDSEVRALEVFNGELFAGGYFQSIGDDVIKGFARWDGETWQEVEGGIEPTCPSCLVVVQALRAHEGNLYVGGLFNGAGGNASKAILRWDGNQWHGLAGGTNSWVYAIGVYDSDIVVGGSFITAGNVSSTGVARWDGATWHPLGQGVSGPNPVVFALDEYDGALMVGGMFPSVPGVPNAGYIAQWNGTEWSAVGNGLIGRVSALIVHDQDLYAGGEFYRHLRQWDGDTWEMVLVPGAGTGPPTSINSLIVHQSGLVGAGNGFIAEWDGSYWESLGTGISGSVLDMTLHNSDLIVAGGITMAGGQPTHYVARWDRKAWHSMGEPWTYWVRALTVYEGELIGAGYNFIRRWNGAAWEQLATGTAGSPNETVRAMMVHENDLIAAGAFTAIDDQPMSRIARWDGESWHPLGDGVGPSEVLALAEYQGDLYVGGRFLTAGGKPASRIARWDGESWHPVGSGVGGGTLFPRVETLRVYNGDLIVAGRFSTAGDVPVNNIARWDGANWHAMHNGLQGQEVTSVRALSAWNGDLVAGGQFAVAGDFTSQFVAHWGPAETCPTDIAPGCGDGATNVFDVLAVLGKWGPCSDCAADLNGDGLVNTSDLFLVLMNWGPCP